MNSTQAKQIPLSKILKQLGHSPHHEVRGDVWYFSPFRKESEASFKIDTRQNVWFDYGEGAGGNGLDFINYLHHGRKCTDGSDVSFALEQLRELTSEYKASRDYQTPDLVARPASTGSPQENESIEVVKMRKLQNEALTGYLRERGISLHTASPYLNEIYYKRGGKNYFALCFPNDSGGYELRNKYFKGVHGSKDISMIELKNLANEKKIDGEQAVTTVFEGFIDFLSALEHHGKPITTPVIVLNSVAMKDRAVKAIKEMGVDKVYLYLDNDVAGRELTDHFNQQLAGMTIIDNSVLYAKYKDFNEFLVNSKKQAKSP